LNDVPGCLGCDLNRGRQPLPGGRIYDERGWLIEHCIGPLGVGTLLLKPARHVERFSDLTSDEYAAFGRVVWLATAALKELLGPDQTYVCQWAHAGWTPGHIHYVVQPAWNDQQKTFERPGPFMQTAMFKRGETPPTAEVEAFCDRARESIGKLAGG